MTARAFSNINRSNRAEAGISKLRLWSGRALSTLAILFLAMDGGMKLFKPPFVVEATIQLGYPETAIVGIGAALLISTLLYVLPRTAIFGAILLTGYLGGAVASGVRIGAPIFNIIFPIVFGVIVWASVAMRNPRLERVLFHS
ncbi:MAG TPA: DoxX family protein [Bryobacteraceae bacterium]|nr:DoxX family protein [Bryobacteraceae bacterium]